MAVTDGSRIAHCDVTALIARKVFQMTTSTTVRVPATCQWALLGLLVAAGLSGLGVSQVAAQDTGIYSLRTAIDQRAREIEPQVVAWRRDIHENPELGNREFHTSALVAEHLRRLGLEVRTEVAHTGVVATLRGGLPGPVVALRADMDALPVTEQVELPFASRVRTTYNGQDGASRNWLRFVGNLAG